MSVLKAKIIFYLKKFFNKFGVDIVRDSRNLKIPLYEKVYSQSVLEKKPFFNIGAGSFYHPFWTNIDYVSEWYRGVQKDVIHHDLMSKNPLPIESASAKIMYTSHTIEHVKEEAVQVLFDEAYRCLEPGGIFRITTGPDAETDYRALLVNDDEWFYWDKWWDNADYKNIFHEAPSSRPIAERWLHHVASQLAPNDRTPSEFKFTNEEIWEEIETRGFPEVLDYFCSLCEFKSDRPGNHISWWTHDKIMTFLREAGFRDIYRSGHGQSVSPFLRNSNLFDSTHPQMSIYVEAIR